MEFSLESRVEIEIEDGVWIRDTSVLSPLHLIKLDWVNILDSHPLLSGDGLNSVRIGLPEDSEIFKRIKTGFVTYEFRKILINKYRYFYLDEIYRDISYQSQLTRFILNYKDRYSKDVGGDYRRMIGDRNVNNLLELSKYCKPEKTRIIYVKRDDTYII